MWTFLPIYKQTIWGGDSISHFKQEPPSADNVGESWEISDVDKSTSIVSEGPDKGLSLRQIVKRDKETLLGRKNYLRFGDNFPLLVKFIDARCDLSIQVHPDDDLAQKLGHKMGKSEMWYVVNATDTARITAGFNHPVTEQQLKESLEDGKLTGLLKEHEIQQGDAFFIPAGRIHAIGAGSLICEIQQTSDVSFRLFDYNRKDDKGKARDLHVDEALQAIDLQDCDAEKILTIRHEGIPVNLVTSPFFCANLLETDRRLLRDYSEWDTFVILVATDGEAVITSGEQKIKMKAGSTILIPASSRGIEIKPAGKFTALEAYIK